MNSSQEEVKKAQLEESMKSNQSNWKFDDTVTPVFDEHVRQSVPLYDEMHRLVVDYSQWFVEEGTNIFDIGTSTGEALKNLTDAHRHKESIQYIGLDTSPSMILKARERFRIHPDVSIFQEDITNSDAVVKNASYVVSILTAQFVPPRKRQDMINKIYKGLNKGGGFVMIEKVVGYNPRFNEMFIEQYHEMKLRNGLTVEHVFDKSRSIRGVMRPFTIDENKKMLTDAGFKDIDTFFRWNNFVGFIAVK